VGEGLWVGLAAAVSGIRAELETAQESSKGSGLRFEVGPIELEFAVDIREDRTKSGGVDVRVLSLGASKDVGLTEAHRLKLTLLPKDAEAGTTLHISDDESDLPPR
jgi:Trypsin-co-occurring domain 2